METTITIIVIAIVTAAIASGAAYLLTLKALQKRKEAALKEAESEGEMIKKEKNFTGKREIFAVEG